MPANGSVTVVFDVTVAPGNQLSRTPPAVAQAGVTIGAGASSVWTMTPVLQDVVPTGTTLYVSTASGNPVEFIDGAAASGLGFNYASNVGHSSQPGGTAPFSDVPIPDANGFDAAVTAVRVAPTGTMAGASGASQPGFTVRIRVRVN